LRRITVTVDTSTGEIVPVSAGFAVMTLEEAAKAAQWVRDMQRSVLVAGEDYAQYGEAQKPTLLKSGAEMLCLASSASSRIELMHEYAMGYRYKCIVTMPNGREAECEGTADYGEWNFAHGKYRAPRNTLLKMAQKRAYVGAVLLAHAASGLFVADVGDDGERPTDADEDRRIGHEVTSGASETTSQPERQGEQAGQGDAQEEGGDLYAHLSKAAGKRAAELANKLGNNTDAVRHAFKEWRTSKHYAWPPADLDTLKAMEGEYEAIDKRAAEDAESYGGGDLVQRSTHGDPPVSDEEWERYQGGAGLGT
jgi:hypothetical protein